MDQAERSEAAKRYNDADPTWRCPECGASNSKSHTPQCRWELVDRTPVAPEPPDMTHVAEYPPTTVARIYWREGWAEGYRAALIATGGRS
jgi:hypothetical protein